ncbi:hypothetical protein BD410DRAFT_792869 [Rickenella mellea]|uniref:Uncharacterized protein n=1 Tax=Rickenella mellea TaxID=50990 RepID=A0A4Y7PVT8_9AGAM|nr:hypothetical protein BD410DRAFT_792869 [Rickenella mellea]
MDPEDVHRKRAEAKSANVLGSDARGKDAEIVKPGGAEAKDATRDIASTSEEETPLGRGDTEPADAKVRDEQPPELSSSTSPTSGEELEWRPRGRPARPAGAQKPPPRPR